MSQMRLVAGQADACPTSSLGERTPFAPAAFRRALLRWYRQSARDLPWRRTRDPYRIWVSEVLLQQTRAETGRAYYERFLAALPDIRALAAAPLDRVLKLWEGLGYYARARNLHHAAQVMVHERAGRLPNTAEGWRQLPGVGPYTAAAIASIAHGKPVPAIDGNVKRVLTRLFRITTTLDSGATQAQCRHFAGQLLARSAPGEFNQAMMELGARVCQPRRPSCTTCPVRRWCGAAAAGVAGELPRRRTRRPRPHVQELALLIWRGRRYLLVQRPHRGLLGGLWELPTVAQPDRRSSRAVLAARVRASLKIDVTVGRRLAVVAHAYSHRSLRVHLHECRCGNGRVRPNGYAAARWIVPGNASEYALSRITTKLLNAATRANKMNSRPGSARPRIGRSAVTQTADG